MAGQQSITNINAIAVARGTSSPSNTEVLWLKPSNNPKGYEDLQIYDGSNWILVSRTPNELLSDLKTVDGKGSGLDSDTLQGYTPAQLMLGQSVPALSVGELLVGQADTVGAAKTVSGIVTVSATGAFVYVSNSISHTGLTGIGTNTHAQIDSHISDSAIHVSTAQATKLSNITITQAVDLDQMEIDVTANNAKAGITPSQSSAITANTAKVTNATHTGEVTGSGALTISDDIVDEANLKVSNTPTNGYVLTAQSGNTGGLTWAEAAGGNNIANSNLTLDADRILDYNGNSLTLNGDTILKGSATGSTTNNLLTTDILGTERFKVTNQGQIYGYNIGGTVNYGLSLNNTALNNPAIELRSTNHVNGSNASIDFKLGSGTTSWTSIKSTYHALFDPSLALSTTIGAKLTLRKDDVIIQGETTIGTESISLQNNTLIKGSDNSASTSGFKVTDINNVSLLDIKNNGELTINDSLVFKDLGSYYGLSHKDVAAAFGTSYSLLQSDVGQTALNSASGQVLNFAIGNSIKMIIAATGNISTTNDLTVGGNLILTSWKFESSAGGSSIKNVSLSGANEYSLYQNNSGATILNSASGQVLNFAIDNSTKISLNSTSLGVLVNTSVKGSDNAAATSGFKVTDVNNVSLVDIRNNGQTSHGGIIVTDTPHAIYSNSISTGTNNILRLYNDSDVCSISLEKSGAITSFFDDGVTPYFKVRRSGTTPKIELFHGSQGQVVNLESSNCYLNPANGLVIGGTANVDSKAKFQLRNTSSGTSFQKFFGNITSATTGRITSSASFGVNQKGFESFDTTLNKKFIWNGTGWEKIKGNIESVSVASATTITPNIDNSEMEIVSALASALTIAVPTGVSTSFYEGKELTFRFKDNGTARALTWNGIFTDYTGALPTTTVAGKTVYIGCKYNVVDTKWDVVAVQVQP